MPVPIGCTQVTGIQRAGEIGFLKQSWNENASSVHYLVFLLEVLNVRLVVDGCLVEVDGLLDEPTIFNV
jgi:hypothetical protein